MFKPVAAFTGFSVNDLAKAKDFYTKTLGLELADEQMGLRLKLPHGGEVFVYDKPDHHPATYTMLNLVVPDIDQAVDELISRSVSFERYDGLHQDDKGIARGRQAGMGPDIAWFKDPAGNILAVLQTD
ncbi:MAG TPA: VOC family protein [Candidatus Saccharimonadia bacterium]|jgi:catechol 2,3-dioxygenase-like lactoylglutathione lyase family enzyme